MAKESIVIMKSALVATTLALAAAGAQANGVFWSIGINAPLQPGVSIGTVFSNAPVYPVAPAYYQPAPVVYSEPAYYAPAPVFVRPAPVVYLPRPYYAPYYTPHRGVYATGWAPSHTDHGHDRGHGRNDHRQGREPVMTRYSNH
jgi:hypothetical protein